ncbi:MAG: N-acetylmuramoyl-L-alanine amidase [Pseudomonadota bacterium]
MGALSHPSPNFGKRRGGAAVSLIVLHYTAMESAQAALDRLCDPGAEVSAHYLIWEDGALCALVAEDMRAWHAGAGAWGGVEDVNSASIGIELANDGCSPFPEAQMVALEALLDGVMARHRLGPEAVIAHSDMAPGRKTDPGPRFDWRRLAVGGRAVWPERGEPKRFFEDAVRFGYPREAEDAAVLAAFRSRFRPGAEGPVDDIDASLAADLAHRFGVDQRASTS